METAQMLVEEFIDLDNEEDASGMQTMNMEELNMTALRIIMDQLKRLHPPMDVPVPGPVQLVQRNSSTICLDILERCDERPLWNALMGYGFLVIFLFALIGNCLNLFIYNSDQIRFFIAIRMLCTKLLMNTLMMVVMLPQALRVIRFWEIGGPGDKLYWKFWPYQAYLTNVFGFCAMWLTVLMTAECYIHIFFPSKSKMLCTKQTVWRSYFIILFAALVLASIYPINRTVSLVTKCERTIVKIITSQGTLMNLFEKLHTIADMFLSILVPLSLLVFMTIMIVWRLWIWPAHHLHRLHANGGMAKGAVPQQQNGQQQTGAHSPTSGLLSNAVYNERKGRENHFAAEKRGVTRITLITCFIQLVTETPSMSVLIYVSMFGPNVHKKGHICTWQTISYFLCLCNASLSFFVYITFSTRFRKTMIHRAHSLLHRLFPSLVDEVPATNEFRPKWSHKRMPNSSANHSQQMVLTSRNTSPRNGSQSEGKNQKLLVVTASDPLAGGSKKTSTATLKDAIDYGRQSPVSGKNSNRGSPVKNKLGQTAAGEQSNLNFQNFSLAKFLQDRLQSGQRGKEKWHSAEGADESMATETTNSLETIPASQSGQLNNKESDEPGKRPISYSMNGRIGGNGWETADSGGGGTAGTTRGDGGSRKTSDMNKRSSVCSTTTNTNSQNDAFL